MAIDYQELRTKLHTQVLEKMDLESLNRLREDVARERVREAIRDLLQRERTPLALAEREQMAREIMDELFGLGPLERLLGDSTISDILVNGPNRVYIERNGRLQRVDARFNDSQHLMRIIDRIVSRVGRRIDESSPMVDARLPDGSRVNVIIPPLALDGPSLSIRRFGGHRLSTESLIKNNTANRQMLDLLEACVRGRLNIMIAGGTGAGKTTLLNILSNFIPEYERIVTIEDAAELHLQQEHVVRLETRPPNIEGKGAVKQRQLVINALRMRPDRIIIGEVRGEEAVDMLQAMNTGHEGSLTTIHANTPADAISRLETMVAMAELNLPDKAIRQQIASAINVIVQVLRMPDGTRRLSGITEVTGMDGNSISLQNLFVYERAGFDANNMVRGRFHFSGVRPRFAEKLAANGIYLSPEIFADSSEKGDH
jgi:pilus assembly protein CpaF